MFLNSRRTTYIQYLQPAFILGRCLGIIYFTIPTPKNNFQTILNWLSCMPVIICYLRWSFVATSNIWCVDYINRNRTSVASEIVHFTYILLLMPLRFLIYFICRRRIKTVLIEVDEIDELLKINRLDSPRMKTELTSFLIFSTIRFIINKLLVILSSYDPHSIETELYYCLYIQLIYTEIFFHKLIFNEFSLLFSKLNHDLEINGNLILVTVWDQHRRLSRIILENQPLFNTSILTMLTPLFIIITDAVAAVISTAKAVVANRQIDFVLVGWDIAVCLEFWAIIWFLLRIRTDLLVEVSAYSFLYSSSMFWCKKIGPMILNITNHTLIF